MENKIEQQDPRFLVSVGSFISEKSAIDRAQLCTRNGIRAEIIDKADNIQTNTISALMIIAEQIKKISEKLEAIEKAVDRKQDTKKEVETDEPRTVLDLLKDYKEKRGLSNKDIAAKTGIPRGTMSGYMSGQTQQIPPKALFLIQSALNIPQDEIIKYL